MDLYEQVARKLGDDSVEKLIKFSAERVQEDDYHSSTMLAIDMAKLLTFNTDNGECYLDVYLGDENVVLVFLNGEWYEKGAQPVEPT